jgi:ABC-type transport system involved in Fe-S cluster assembly fused permease/ATPase subunit
MTSYEFTDNYDFDVKERVCCSDNVNWLPSRAYVSNLSILILDEATSSIDSYSEELIQRHRNHNPRKNSIIAHRLATIINADKIVVMDKDQSKEHIKNYAKMDITRACIIHNFQ